MTASAVEFVAPPAADAVLRAPALGASTPGDARADSGFASAGRRVPGLRIDQWGSVAAPSGALYVGTASGANERHGVVLRVPASPLPVVATVAVPGEVPELPVERPTLVALSIVLALDEEIARGPLRPDDVWLPLPAQPAPAASPFGVPSAAPAAALLALPAASEVEPIVLGDAAARDAGLGDPVEWSRFVVGQVNGIRGMAESTGAPVGEVDLPGAGARLTVVTRALAAADAPFALVGGFDRAGSLVALHLVPVPAAPSTEAAAAPVDVMAPAFEAAPAPVPTRAGLPAAPHAVPDSDAGDPPFGSPASSPFASSDGDATGARASDPAAEPLAALAEPAVPGEPASSFVGAGREPGASADAAPADVVGSSTRGADEMRRGADEVRPADAASGEPAGLGASIDAAFERVKAADAEGAAHDLRAILDRLESEPLSPQARRDLADRGLSTALLADALCDLEIDLGDHAAARRTIEAALASPAEVSRSERVHLNKRLGELALRSGDYDTAVSALEAAQTDAEEVLRNPERSGAETMVLARDSLAHAHLLLADAALEGDDLPRAAAAASRSREQFAAARRWRLAARASFVLAEAHERLGEAREREEALRLAAELSKRGDQPSGQAVALGLIAEAAAQRGEFGAAIGGFGQARDLLEAAGLPGDAAVAARNAALCAERLGDAVLARRAAEDAEQLERAAADASAPSASA